MCQGLADGNNRRGELANRRGRRSEPCIQGCCDCKHVVGDAQVRFKPCRAFVKALLGDAVDKDWEYIVKGAFFGFEVINKDCAVEFSCDNYNSVTTGHNYNLMSRKLRADLDKESLTVVGSSPACVHALGCAPKGEGIRGIADCSRLEGGSVNDHVDQVSEKFSYKDVRDVTEILCENEYLSRVDISDAYRAIHTTVESRTRQGLAWDFGEGKVFLKDNRLCMGLASAPFVFNRISDFVVRILE